MRVCFAPANLVPCSWFLYNLVTDRILEAAPCHIFSPGLHCKSEYTAYVPVEVIR